MYIAPRKKVQKVNEEQEKEPGKLHIHVIFHTGMETFCI